MPKIKSITIITGEEVSVNPNRNKTSIRIEEPDVNEIISSIDNDDLVTYIQSEYDPGDVFSEEDLIKWAEENGYIKE